MATPPPQCPHGTSYAQPCYSCGWVCPTCKRSYAPWVRECNYRHEENADSGWTSLHHTSTGATQVSYRFPPEWSEPGYQHMVRAGSEWRDILPGIQVLCGQPVHLTGEAILHFRLTPGGGSE